MNLRRLFRSPTFARWRRTAVLAGGMASLTGMSVASSGCADNNVSIFIRQVQALTTENECTAPNDPEAFVNLTGEYDVVFANPSVGYEAIFLFGNQLVQTGDTDRLRSESNRVTVFQADVVVLNGAGAEVASYPIAVNGFADPAVAGNPGFGIFRGVILPLNVAQAAVPERGNEATLVSRVRVFGETVGGVAVESEFYDFPITVRNGTTSQGLPADSETPCAEPIVFAECIPGQDARSFDSRRDPLFDGCPTP